MSARVLFFDTETSPLKGYAWRPFDTDLVKITEDWHFLSAAWKWQGSKTIECVTSQGAPSDDYQIAAALQDCFDQADVVVAHNAKKFDIRKANARMAWWGLDPPSHYRVVDTLILARQHFAFTFNRLDDLCQNLDIGQKLPHTGFAMWEGCMADDPKAWKLMERYNKHDVRILEKLYEALTPWNPSHPNLALVAEKPDACPRCLKQGTLIVRGYRHNQVTSRAQFQCTNCRGYCYGRPVVKSAVKHTL